MTRPAKIEAFVHEGRVRTAMVRCPFCAALHEHVVPDDILPHAELVRSPKCGSKKTGGADYRLILPGEWTEEHEQSDADSAPRKKGKARESFDGKVFGALVILSNGPDLVSEVNGQPKKRRQFFARCECGRIPLIRASSLTKIRSCGCAMGRPKDHTSEYESWIKQSEAAAS